MDVPIQLLTFSASGCHLLHTAAYQIEAINDYFSKNSNFAKQALRDKLNALYSQSKRRFSRKKALPEFADLVFFDLLGGMIPKAMKSGDPRQRVTMLQVAAEVAEKNDLQYIATLNEHDVNSMQSQVELNEGEFQALFNEETVILRLSDERVDKKLLGISVDMNYLEE